MYGEYHCYNTAVFDDRESPPCVWGVLAHLQGMQCRPRNHPHVYGEYLADWTSATKPGGITPMCMGSTLSTTFCTTPCENHPHVYGEYSVLFNTLHFSMRITPMCMGSTEISDFYYGSYEESPPCVWGVPTIS